MECKARLGLEACLCLCLGLIDFPENCCSRPPPSSLMKPSGICHPTTRPTPALAPVCRLHPFPLPPAETYAHRHARRHTHAQSQTNIRMHTQAKRAISCLTQAANKGSLKRMCHIVAFVYAHCLRFCLVALLLYPRTKRRGS